MTQLRSEACLLCGCRTFDPIFQVDRFPLVIGAVPAERPVPEFPLEIQACRDCALVQQLGRLDPKDVDLLYTADYYSCSSPVLAGMGASEIDKFVSFFETCGLKSGELLEIACFDGYLLLKLAERGWSVYGCDPASQAKIAVEKLGSERVSRGFFKAGAYAPARFDAIIARNLLEHIYDLHDFLRAVSAALKEGGRLLIEVPNVHTTLEMGVFASFFHQHISYFSKATLDRLLAENGFASDHWLAGPTLMVCARKTGLRTGQKPEPGAVALDRKLVSGFVKSSGALRSVIINAFAEPGVRRAALFGASAVSTTIVNLLDKISHGKLKAIFDNDGQKHGKLIHGCAVPICAPTAEALADIDVLLITSYLFEVEIRRQLMSLGFPESRIKPLFPAHK